MLFVFLQLLNGNSIVHSNTLASSANPCLLKASTVYKIKYIIFLTQNAFHTINVFVPRPSVRISLIGTGQNYNECDLAFVPKLIQDNNN